MIDFSRRRRMNWVRGHGTSGEVVVVVGDCLDDGLPPVDGGICDVPDVLDDLDSTGSGMDRLLIKVLSSRLLCLRCQMLKLL